MTGVGTFSVDIVSNLGLKHKCIGKNLEGNVRLLMVCIIQCESFNDMMPSLYQGDRHANSIYKHRPQIL